MSQVSEVHNSSQLDDALLISNETFSQINTEKQAVIAAIKEILNAKNYQSYRKDLKQLMIDEIPINYNSDDEEEDINRKKFEFVYNGIISAFPNQWKKLNCDYEDFQNDLDNALKDNMYQKVIEDFRKLIYKRLKTDAFPPCLDVNTCICAIYQAQLNGEIVVDDMKTNPTERENLMGKLKLKMNVSKVMVINTI